MRIYEVYYRNYREGRTEKIALLIERRNDLLRQNGLEWARRLLGNVVRDVHSIFVREKEAE
ncbi:MAG: hypothetical protein ACE144_06235 [Thermodesulfobacteriota bacterium]